MHELRPSNTCHLKYFPLNSAFQITYHFFHWKKGTPFADDQGMYNQLTWWEQIDNGKQLTRNRKFLVVVPVVLWVLSVLLLCLIGLSFFVGTSRRNDTWQLYLQCLVDVDHNIKDIWNYLMIVLYYNIMMNSEWQLSFLSNVLDRFNITMNSTV
jgi:hypothetical protein